MIGCTDFRDQLIAASLKPSVPSSCQRFERHFRDQLIAASLKQDVNLQLQFSGADFRDQLIAASLKHEWLIDALRRALQFPRSIDRGLIEATIRSADCACGGTFPRSIDRGLIEALR